MSGAADQKIDPKLLEVLVCPLTKTTLEYDAAAQELISRAAGLAFPILEGIPRMRLRMRAASTKDCAAHSGLRSAVNQLASAFRNAGVIASHPTLSVA